MAAIGTDIAHARELLCKDEVVGMPTETVYGLAGNALSERAISKIFDVKNRPKFDPLIAHFSCLEEVEPWVTDFPEKLKVLAQKYWPGPLTLLLPKHPKIPDLLTSGHPRVAVRVPAHPVAQCLLNELDFPLAAPSANPFGYVSPVLAAHVSAQLGHKISYILDGGRSTVGVESTIVGIESGQMTVYRLGGVTLEEIEDAIGETVLQTKSTSHPAAPGLLDAHYSPGRKVLVGNISENLRHENPDHVGVVSFKESHAVPPLNLFVLSPAGDLTEAAQNIFAALRKMDQPHIHKVLAEWLPEVGLGRAINDRLRRASF